MTEEQLQPQKIPLIFFTGRGREESQCASG